MHEELITLEKRDHSDCCPWEPFIPATLSISLQTLMKKTRVLLAACEELHSINLHVPVDFWSFKTELKLQEQCRFDTCYLRVYRTDFRLCLQAKYNSIVQAEWERG